MKHDLKNIMQEYILKWKIFPAKVWTTSAILKNEKSNSTGLFYMVMQSQQYKNYIPNVSQTPNIYILISKNSDNQSHNIVAQPLCP